MDEVFEGNRLETGVLQRARRWRDAIPGLVLVDAVRVAGSPLCVGMIWLTIGLHHSLLSLDLSRHGIPLTSWIGQPGPQSGFPWSTPPWTDLPPLADVPPGSGAGDSALAITLGLVRLALVGLLWLVPSAIVARAGACYVAGRPQPFSWQAREVLRRFRVLVTVAVLPLLAVLVLVVAMTLLGCVGRLARFPLLGWVDGLATLATLPFAILAGLLAVGATVAVPLAIVAAAIEKQPDAIDCLSRGYEYAFRRLVHLAIYLVAAGLLVLLLVTFGSWLASAATHLGGFAVRLGSGSDSMATSLAGPLAYLPLALGVTTAWGLAGAVYLLMRLAANEQEMEDIAVTEYEMRPPDLPSLHTPEPEQAVAP
ncbi:MAG: hypothetical protein EA381_18790 [Planctomycetaceae bacterium]|nr:MAG: hypothetical protein EA381_18790 [Planctomycetaceae bacterium]